jgi:enamine deaminase RidA (YjgF/YER057c/UK114 family)
MDTNSTMRLVSGEGSRPVGAEQRLKELGIKLPAPPEPFGTYVEAVQTGNLLFLTGMLPTEGRAAKFIGRVGAELDVEAGRQAAYLAALNGLAVAREHLGSLDKVTRIVRLGVSVATSGDVRDQPKVADGASELLQDIFGKEKNPSRLVYGVASLPLGAPVELEIIFEVVRYTCGDECPLALPVAVSGFEQTAEHSWETKYANRNSDDEANTSYAALSQLLASNH